MNDGHPAWQEILSVLPEEFHPLIKPTLKKWDDGVAEKINGLHSQYEPYKQFVDNKVDPQYLVNAYNLAQNVQNNPQQVAQQMIEAFNLDYVSKDQVAELQQQSDDVDFSDASIDDLQKHPVFKQMITRLDQLQNQFEEQRQQETSQQELQEFEQYLAQLEEQHGEFNKKFVTALIAQGVDGVEAVKEYKSMLGQQLTNQVSDQQNPTGSGSTDAPPVITGDGSSGSGLEEQAIDFGAVKTTDLNSMVADMLKQQNQQ